MKNIRQNEKYPPISDLNDIPSPYLQGVFDLKPFRSAELVVSRGCRWRCRYCAINEGGLRYFSFQRIRAELETLVSQAPNLEEVSVIIFDMFDDVAVAEPLLSLFRRVAEEKGIRFSFDVNVNSLGKPELLGLVNLEQFCLEVGVQSVGSKTLAACGRRTDARRIDENIALLRRYAPKASVTLSFIRGLPGDTAEGYQDTLNWAMSTGYDVLINHLRILPGTGFDRDRKRYGIETDERYPYFATSTRTFPRKDMRRMTRFTDRIGFVMKLASYDKFLKHGLDRMGEALRGAMPRSFLVVAGRFCEHLERTELFGDMLQNHLRNRKSSRSLDWSLDCEDFGNFSRGALLKEFLKFRRTVLEKYGRYTPWPELERAVEIYHSHRRVKGEKVEAKRVVAGKV